MPNWIINEVKVKASEKDFRELCKSITSKDAYNQPQIDFNKILPSPKELEGTTAPAKIISEGEYLLQQIKIQEGEKVFAKGITKEMSNKLKKQYGVDNWYDWNVNNWGTKWNANNTQIDDLFFSFETAWSIPTGIFIALSKKFPQMTFTVDFTDEDIGYNCGTIEFKNGEVKENILEGGSYEAYKKAMGVWGNCIGDYEDYDEEELKDGITEEKLRAMVELELEYREFSPTETKNVMEYAIKYFSKIEEYETAEQIKEYLS